MAKQKKSKDNDLELLESSEALAQQLSKGEEFLRDNSNMLAYVLGGLAILLLGGWFLVTTMGGFNLGGLRYATEEKEQEALAEMYQAQYFFEADSLESALNGKGDNLGFVEIADEFGMTKAGNLANFYAGVAYLKKGDFEDAVEYLGNFSTDDLIFEARKYALIGDAHSELNNADQAISNYKKACSTNENKYYTPIYLMKLAIAQEGNQDYSGAVATYERIINDYPTSVEYNDAKKYKALAESKM